MRTSEFEKWMDSIKALDLDITRRSVPFKGGSVEILYVAQLTDRAALSENLVKPLVIACASGAARLNAQEALDGVIYADSVRIETDKTRVLEFVLGGMTVALFSTDESFLVVNFKKVEKRSVSTPQLAYSVRGGQDCFTENLDANLSLVRYRIKDPKMRIKFTEVGVRTKARVAIIYIDDVANPAVVEEICRRIHAVEVDGIGESGELQSLLLNDNKKFFPQMGLIERSDLAYHSLLEGKVLVLVDGSGIALSAPKVFSEYFYACDDRYDNKFYGMFNRFIRYVAIVIALTASSLFVAVTSFHTEVLPSDYAISLAQMRANVPFNAMVGALLLESLMELLREALIRVPRQIGPAIGIVGAIVIGQASIAAGFFSPVLLTIAAVSLLCSFAIPDYTLISPFRILKFLLILLTGSLGFFGFTAFLTLIGIELVSMNSFGTPFMAPWAPFNQRDFTETLLNQSDTQKERPGYLHPLDKIRKKVKRHE
jgi:spore germination protein KA/spore germination protein